MNNFSHHLGIHLRENQWKITNIESLSMLGIFLFFCFEFEWNMHITCDEKKTNYMASDSNLFSSYLVKATGRDNDFKQSTLPVVDKFEISLKTTLTVFHSTLFNRNVANKFTKIHRKQLKNFAATNYSAESAASRFKNQLKIYKNTSLDDVDNLKSLKWNEGIIRQKKNDAAKFIENAWKATFNASSLRSKVKKQQIREKMRKTVHLKNVLRMEWSWTRKTWERKKKKIQRSNNWTK